MRTFGIYKNLQVRPDDNIEMGKEGWFKDILPKKYYKRRCRHCGFVMNFYTHKKKLCRMCNNYVYPDDKEEFRERMKEVIKNEKSK